MIKSFLIIISLQILLYAHQQIILSVADNFNSSKADLECFEDGKKVFRTISVNLGAKGLGMGIGIEALSQKSSYPLKHEGDKKAPAGVFKLTALFGYKPESSYKMPYLYASKNLICVDDSGSSFYNRIIHMPEHKPKSFEYMKRNDDQYKLGIVIQHNANRIKERGSCIFMHVQKADNAPTVGCTSMRLQDLQKIASWLDEKKNPILIQIPKLYAKEILKLYPQLQRSELLR